MPKIGDTHVWADEEILEATDLNAAFDEHKTKVNAWGAWVDATATITAAWTFNTSPTFPAAVTFAVGATITANGLTITAGGLTVTAGTTAVQALTCTTLTPSGLSALQAVTVATTLGVTGLATLDDVVLTGQGANLRSARVDWTGAVALDWAGGNDRVVRLTGNVSGITFSNAKVGSWYSIEIQQDATGSRTISWPAGVKWGRNGTALTLTTTANRKDVVVLKCMSEAAGAGTYLASVFDQDFNDTTA